MGMEKQIDSIDSDDSELNSAEEPEDTIQQVLDERDFIEPPAQTGAEPFDSPAPIKAVPTQVQDTKEVEIPLFADDAQQEDPPVKPETEISLTVGETEIIEESASHISPEAMPDENDDPGNAEPGGTGMDVDEDSPSIENITATERADDADDTVEAAAENQAPEALPEGEHGDLTNRPSADPPTESPAAGNENDFDAGEDDIIADTPQEVSQKEDVSKTAPPNKSPAAGNENDFDAGEDEIIADKPQEVSPKEDVNKTAEVPAAQTNADRPSSISKMIGLALLVLIAAGIIIYHNPSLIGLTKAMPPAAAPPVSHTVSPVTPVPPNVEAPAASSKLDQCLAKIEEAVRLRNELLEKKNEIHELDLFYRNGIHELEKQVYQDTQKAGIATYEQALKNKRIELNLRTIQRRRAYIRELAKPAFWTISGSEELYYLIRKAQLDLQLIDIAGGIDLKKHMRHLNAAVHKYRPSPEKLAVDPPQSNLQPLKKIWQQANSQKYQLEQISLKLSDEQVLEEICAGNFNRIAELTSISPDAAKCLSRKQGSDLFLNRVTTLSPEAAKELFQWQGNWICLNGVKELSPSAAEYLFKWKGSWISLNSLRAFPPELAQYLLKWEGQQLELMGLNLNKKEEDQKTLKYLALWETTGGKLYVPDKIRKEIESLM